MPVVEPEPHLPRWLRAWWPAPLSVDRTERRRMVLGAGLGLLITALLSQCLQPALPWSASWPWLAAPLGASAVLVFGLPASPLAQPWAVVGGNTVAAMVGVACAALPWPPSVTGPLAAALALGAMLVLRCLHPPGGAVALLAVLLGVTHGGFALFPVMVNSVALVAAGVAYNHATGRRYPHTQRADRARAARASVERFTEADIDVALQRYNQLVELPRDDLHDLLEQAEVQAHDRLLRTLCCEDVMSRDPITAGVGTSLSEAWTKLRRHRIKALPVIDASRRVVGIVTQADFIRLADPERHPGSMWPMTSGSPAQGDDNRRPECVGQIMTSDVRVAVARQCLGELLPIFSATGHHHLPVIDDDGALVGILTQTDLVRSLAGVPGA